MSTEFTLIIVFGFLQGLSIGLGILGGHLIGYSKGKAQPKPDDDIGTSCNYCIEYEDQSTNAMHKYDIPASDEADALMTFMHIHTNFLVCEVKPIGSRYQDYD